MKKLRIGIIGAGQIAETAHLPYYLKLNDLVELVAVSDTNLERAENLCSLYKIEKVFENYKDMLMTCNLDGVSICVPNKFHCRVAIDALNAGCHVFCEKPPAMNYEEARFMYETAQNAGKILTYNFHYRFSEEVKTLKGSIDQGTFGKIYAVRVQALRRRGIPGWGNFTNKEIQGGGPLIDIGVHMLDTALYLMGYPEPDYAAAGTHQMIGNRPGVGLMGSWDPNKMTVEDSAFGFIRFKNGATLNLETSFALNIKEKSMMNVHIFGEKAGASVFPLEIYSENSHTLTDTSFPYLQQTDKYEGSLKNFVMAGINNEKPLIKGEEALTVQKLIDALYQSSASGRPITL